jgi:hypothetical protein
MTAQPMLPKLAFGLDLSDATSRYCALDRHGQVVATAPGADQPRHPRARTGALARMPRGAGGRPHSPLSQSAQSECGWKRVGAPAARANTMALTENPSHGSCNCRLHALVRLLQAHEY